MELARGARAPGKVGRRRRAAQRRHIFVKLSWRRPFFEWRENNGQVPLYLFVSHHHRKKIRHEFLFLAGAEASVVQHLLIFRIGVGIARGRGGQHD
jgi:hypothetical protein